MPFRLAPAPQVQGGTAGRLRNRNECQAQSTRSSWSQARNSREWLISPLIPHKFCLEFHHWNFGDSVRMHITGGPCHEYVDCSANCGPDRAERCARVFYRRMRCHRALRRQRAVLSFRRSVAAGVRRLRAAPHRHGQNRSTVARIEPHRDATDAMHRRRNPARLPARALDAAPGAIGRSFCSLGLLERFDRKTSNSTPFESAREGQTLSPADNLRQIGFRNGQALRDPGAFKRRVLRFAPDIERMLRGLVHGRNVCHWQTFGASTFFACGKRRVD